MPVGDWSGALPPERIWPRRIPSCAAKQNRCHIRPILAILAQRWRWALLPPGLNESDAESNFEDEATGELWI